MPFALGSLILLVLLGWGLRRALREGWPWAPRAGREAALGQLDNLLRDLESRRDGPSPRQQLAAVRGRGPRQHVWCAPGGEEVFLN